MSTQTLTVHKYLKLLSTFKCCNHLLTSIWWCSAPTRSQVAKLHNSAGVMRTSCNDCYHLERRFSDVRWKPQAKTYSHIRKPSAYNISRTKPLPARWQQVLRNLTVTVQTHSYSYYIFNTTAANVMVWKTTQKITTNHHRKIIGQIFHNDQNTERFALFTVY